MTLSVSERTKNYRQRKALAGYQRIEITLPAETVAQLDHMAGEEGFTRARYIAVIIANDYEEYLA